MTNRNSGVVSLKRALVLVRRLKRLGKTVVTTNGCFDLLHPGHVAYLQAARKLGDALIVGINSDASVRLLKGKGRPLNPAFYRASVVAALKGVDFTFIFPDRTPIPFLKVLRPPIHVKGGDYSGRLVEQDTVERYGGKVRIIPCVKGLSTTRLIERIKAWA